MSAVIYKCPNCGGDLRFEPEGQQFRCEYCQSEFSKGQIGDFSEAAGMLYSCPSCGAELVAEETTAATFCYYCHNPVVLAGRVQGEYHPDGILPFEIDRKKALEILGKWIAGKKYVPKAFYSQDQVEKMTGVYFPYWLYDCQVEGKLEGEARKQTSWTEGSMRLTQTEEYEIRREGTMEINHVARNALSKANRKLAEGVMPFEMEKLQPFHMGYLSGFMAENRDMEQGAFAPDIEAEIRQFAEDSLRSGISGYHSVNVRAKETQIQNPRWSYVLMPVWALTYRDNRTDKVYYFACNGQTGKVCGELPVDERRLLQLFLSVFAPVLAVLLAVGYFIL
ncbi:MAG: TFIIB-type zinc ribbon-containing protein [Lachnospiraceae bacterium]|nr:TFIIB-type zinc ribbon-containing protein [Lachnospiraceae bacterium]